MDDNELIQWYKRVFDEYPSVGLLAFIREVMEQAAATALEQAAPVPAMEQPTRNNVPLYTNEQIDDIVDKHIFLDNGTSTYRVWEDRANKYLREMRDRYEQELAFWQRYGINKNLELVDAKGMQRPTNAARKE